MLATRIMQHAPGLRPEREAGAVTFRQIAEVIQTPLERNAQDPTHERRFPIHFSRHGRAVAIATPKNVDALPAPKARQLRPKHRTSPHSNSQPSIDDRDHDRRAARLRAGIASPCRPGANADSG